MSNTIHFGVFVSNPAAALRAAEQGGVMDYLSSDGDSFLAWGQAPSTGDPIHVKADLSAVGDLAAGLICEGRNRIDALLTNGDRLTDYGVVTDENDNVVQVFSLLTGDVESLEVAAEPAPAPAPVAPARPARWSPFR